MRGTAADGHCHAKTGTLSDVSALAGYCKARSGHQDRVRDPDERRQRGLGARGAGPHGRGACRRLAELAAAFEQLLELLLVEHRDLEFLRLRQLRARVGAGDDVVGLARDRAGDLPPASSILCLASSRVRFGSVPVRTKVLPSSGPAAALDLTTCCSSCSPALRNAVISLRLRGSASVSTSVPARMARSPRPPPPHPRPRPRAPRSSRSGRPAPAR